MVVTPHLMQGLSRDVACRVSPFALYYLVFQQLVVICVF